MPSVGRFVSSALDRLRSPFRRGPKSAPTAEAAAKTTAPEKTPSTPAAAKPAVAKPVAKRPASAAKANPKPTSRRSPVKKKPADPA